VQDDDIGDGHDLNFRFDRIIWSLALTGFDLNQQDWGVGSCASSPKGKGTFRAVASSAPSFIGARLAAAAWWLRRQARLLGRVRAGGAELISGGLLAAGP
jgi:hypothetical protein